MRSKIFSISLLILTLILSGCKSMDSKGLDPYNYTVLVTNTVSWPDNKVTHNNDSFKFGTADSGNEDALILASADKGTLKFPKDFGWAVAGSAYQYEGRRIKPDEKNPSGIGWSIWDVFSEPNSWLNPANTNIDNVPPTSNYTYPSGRDAIKGFYPDYYKRDIDLAGELGVGYYRLSISWPRLFPKEGMTEPDKEGLDYYIGVLEYLKKKKIVPLITLYHWDLPAWLYNYGDPSIPENQRTYGWLDMNDAYNNLLIKEFQKYVDVCFNKFGKYTRFFATFNEPGVFTNCGLHNCGHAPGRGGWEILRAKDPGLYGNNEVENLRRLNYLQSGNIIKAHYVAYRTFDKYRNDISKNNGNQEALLGIVLNADWPEPYRIIKDKNGDLKYHPDDIAASKRSLDFSFGWWLDPILFGNWPKSMIETVGVLPSGRLPNLSSDKTWLTKDGTLSDKYIEGSVKLADYISSGGAADYLGLNHYTGSFVADEKFAKEHYSREPKPGAVPINQYGMAPESAMPGWETDLGAFATQFRYFKHGDTGEAPPAGTVYVIGNTGSEGWLRQTWFVYRKLLRYIQYAYLSGDNGAKASKHGKKLKDLGIYLTENGTSLYKESQLPASEKLSDKNRIQYIKGNLASLHQALQDGVNVKLYTYWSLLDNFEWTSAFNSRFGLVWVNYDQLNDPVKSREPKDSFYYFKDCVRNDRVSKDTNR